MNTVTVEHVIPPKNTMSPMGFDPEIQSEPSTVSIT